MQARIVRDSGGHFKAVLQSGESFAVPSDELPNVLRQGGDIELILMPVGEKASKEQARELLNYLLQIE